MNKIVRGEIKSIDASVGKRKGYNYEANIDTLEYIITLNDDKKYQTNCSIEDFKVGDLIDIAIFKKVKEHVKEDYENDCIILNKVTAKKILFDSHFHNSEHYLLFIFSFFPTLFATIDIISKGDYNFTVLFLIFIMFGIVSHIAALTIKGRKEPLFSEEEYNLMKKYRGGYSIKDEEYLNVNKVKQKEAV